MSFTWLTRGNKTVIVYIGEYTDTAAALSAFEDALVRVVITTEEQEVACPVGYTGLMQQEREVITTDGVPAYGGWVTVSDTCVIDTDVVITTETQSVACAAGYTGSIVQERLVTTTNGTPAYGAWNEVSNACVLIPVVLPTGIAIGKIVEITTATGARATPALNAAQVSQLVVGDQGTVSAGPISADSLVWWQANWNGGPQLWVRETRMQEWDSTPPVIPETGLILDRPMLSAAVGDAALSSYPASNYTIPVGIWTPGGIPEPVIDAKGLRFDITPGNALVDWYAKLIPAFGMNSTMHIQWTEEFNANFIATPFQMNGGGIAGNKLAVIGSLTNSSSWGKLVVALFEGKLFPHIYRYNASGITQTLEPPISITPGGPAVDFDWQPKLGVVPTCRYSVVGPTAQGTVPTGCLGIVADTPTTFDLIVVTGGVIAGTNTWDCEVRLYKTVAGTRQLVVNYGKGTAGYTGRNAAPFEALWLNPYVTDKSSTQQYSTCSVWYSDVKVWDRITITESFPGPTPVPPTPPPPAPPPTPGSGQVAPAFDGNGNVLDSWWAGLPLNQWVEVVGTGFRLNVSPLLPVGYRDYGNIAGVFQAWAGAAIDRATGRMWFIGGGHQNSSNNGMYEFALEKMKWRIAMQPTVITAADLAASKSAWNALTPAQGGPWTTYSQGLVPPNDYWRNGEPLACHTYRNLEWIPETGRVFRQGRPGSGHIWQIDPLTGAFTMGMPRYIHSDTASVYDSVTTKVHGFFWDGPSGWGSRRIYDPVANTISTMKSIAGMPVTAYVLPLIVGREIYAFQNNITATTLKTINLDTDVVANVALTNPPALGSTYFSTGDYCAGTGLIYAMQRNGVFTTIVPATGVCATFTPTGTPLAVPISEPAPYGKFRIYERANGAFMVLFNLIDANLRIVKIA